MCRNLFLKKVSGCTYNFIKMRLRHRFFPVNLAKFLRAPFYWTPPGYYLWGKTDGWSKLSNYGCLISTPFFQFLCSFFALCFLQSICSLQTLSETARNRRYNSFIIIFFPPIISQVYSSVKKFRSSLIQ